MAHAKDSQPRHTPLAPAELRSRDSSDRNPQPSSSQSPTSSAAVIASPPTDNEGPSPPRQKRWATKTRTGCITCRIRRVKCDEGKPMCKRCMDSGRMCDGYKIVPEKPPRRRTPKPAQTAIGPVRTGKEDLNLASRSGPRSRHALLRSQFECSTSLIPPDWDLMEAFDYYYRMIFPSLHSNQLDDSTPAYKPTAGNLGCKTSFVTFVFSNRIADAAKNRGSLRCPEDMPQDQYLWTTFHASMVSMIAVINEGLSSSDGAINDSIFVRIVDMLSIDLTLLGSTWQAHLHGYGALYKMRGGYKRLSKVIKSFDHQFQYVYMLHVMTSTTTPAAQMLPIFDDLTPEEIHRVFTFSLYSEIPCSSHIFADLIRINRLRALAGAGASIPGFVRPAARQVFHHIAEFSVVDWEEPYGVPDKPEMPLLCRIFQKAVLLYGLLTLPSLTPPAVTATMTTSNLPSPEMSGPEAGEEGHESEGDGDDEGEPFDDDVELVNTSPPSVETLRSDILTLIREVQPLIVKRSNCLAWPLAVVAVTLTGEGDAAERDFVYTTLFRISNHRDAYYGPTLCLAKLRKFWASGKTGWEDCYDEPCSVLA